MGVFLFLYNDIFCVFCYKISYLSAVIFFFLLTVTVLQLVNFLKLTQVPQSSEVSLSLMQTITP